MPPWIQIWIARWAGGERLQKTSAEDYRIWFGVLFLTPILMTMFMTVGREILDTGTTMTLWIACTAFGLLTCAAIFGWARFVPAKISLILSIVSWGAFFFISPFQ